MTCVYCDAFATKAIYAGFPVKICLNVSRSASSEAGGHLWGFWSFVPRIYFNGVFMTYQGSYINALWHWLKTENF